ncbi:MAG: metal ABC transporter substrate-binding protein [Candidatus Hydrothermales bacterium]
MTTIFLFSTLKIFVTLPWIGWLTKEIGGDKVLVYTLVDGRSDPHNINTKPSMIVEIKKADVLIYNGLDLEIAYLPYLIERSGNPKIMPGQKGHINLSKFIPEVIEKIESPVTRAMGDVHPFGNPHYHFDPLNLIYITDSLTKRLQELDYKNKEIYIKNGEKLKKELSDSLNIWLDRYSNLKGKKFVSYHKLYEYTAKRFGFYFVDYIEPNPGIPPSAHHIKNLVDKIKSEGVSLIITSVYYDKKAPQKISELTGVDYVVLPHDINSFDNIKNYFDLMREILNVLNKSKK